METVQRLDAMEEFAAERLIIGRWEPVEVVYSMAKQFPDVLGLTFAFVLCCVASAIEGQAQGGENERLPRAADIYKAVALLSADLFDLQESRSIAATGTDLLFHWLRNSDPVFKPVRQLDAHS